MGVKVRATYFYAVECGGASEEKLAQMRETPAQVRKLHSLAPNLHANDVRRA